jgi:hypothetical protein
VSKSEASREKLYASWLVWVKANPGRDSRLAAIAANAANDALDQGSDFTGASDAARSAWIGAAGGADPAPRSGPPPLATPYLVFADYGVPYFVDVAAPNIDWVVNLTLVWDWVHLVVIQGPILVLLSLIPSRQWVGLDSPNVLIHDQMRQF